MKFGSKLSVQAFKESVKAETLEVIKSPKSGKLFISANGACVAAVSKNYDSSKPKEFVQLIMEDTGETIWCLHNQASSNTVETL